MYLEYYNLTEKPFSKTPDASRLYLSPAHAEALARMEQAVEDRELMVLTGDVGCGKTTLSRALLDRLPDAVRPAIIINPRLTPNQLLRTIARRLGEDEPRYFRADLIEQIHGLLFDCYEHELLPLLIIDEAQAIPSRETFEEVRLLTNFQLDDRNLMALILMGQPELNARLRRSAYEAFRQRVGVRFHLGPLGPGEVAAYIRFRLSAAGREDELFTPEAVAELASLSSGIPRWINNLAGSALLQGFADDQARIDADIIRDVARDLGLIRDGKPATPGPDPGAEPSPQDPDDLPGFAGLDN
jgi:type II secretory pathway predicted ATPase ExeA